MEKIRKPLQGVSNIIRFNWHFYVIAMTSIFILFIIGYPLMLIFAFLILVTLIISLLVSYYVYDYSKFYTFGWIEEEDSNLSVLNVNAGFDESSDAILRKFANADFRALDFYDPTKHTEVSIKRARKYYPSFPNTTQIETSNIEIENDSIDKIFLVLSAHEIRERKERVIFFSELNRILKPNGTVVVVEHLRDSPNFLAYNVGALHFYSKERWCDIFREANLELAMEEKITPFISKFTLKNGTTS